MSIVEVENYFVWRQKDAKRNSTSMKAQWLYSHTELQGKSQIEMEVMIIDKLKETYPEGFSGWPEGHHLGRSFTPNIPNEINSKFTMMYYDFTTERINLSLNIPHYE